jgi:hypothetical protein
LVQYILHTLQSQQAGAGHSQLPEPYPLMQIRPEPSLDPGFWGMAKQEAELENAVNFCITATPSHMHFPITILKPTLMWFATSNKPMV